jgi:flagellar basal body-associated protein FliL
MTSDTDLPQQADTLQQPRSFKPRKLLVFIAIVLFIALVAGTGGYLLGIRKGQKSEIISQSAPISTITSTTVIITPTVSPTVPVVPTQIPALTTNWKTYTNAR